MTHDTPDWAIPIAEFRKLEEDAKKFIEELSGQSLTKTNNPKGGRPALRNINVGDVLITLKQVSERYGIPKEVLYRRRMAGWSDDDLIQPLGYKRPIEKPTQKTYSTGFNRLFGLKKERYRGQLVKVYVCKNGFWHNPIKAVSDAVAGQVFACFDCRLKDNGECDGYETPTPNPCWDLSDYLRFYISLKMTQENALIALPIDFEVFSAYDLKQKLIELGIKWGGKR